MEARDVPGLRFTLSELAGAFGDFGIIIPLMFAAAVVCRLNLGYIFLFFGIWFIVTGLVYRIPIPVEPMKVIAVVAISGTLAGTEIAAAGILLGVMFFFLGFGRWMQYIEKYVPEAVIRGIQLGLALLLLKSAAEFCIKDPLFFIFGVAVIAVIFAVSYYRKVPDLSALCLMVIAGVIGVIMTGFPEIYPIGLPALVIPGIPDFAQSVPGLVIPQAVVTITNAILATSLLSKDLFTRDVPPAKLSKTIGVMNIVSSPLGGFPMCHGAGGLAAQYRFGARTGGSNIIAGVILLVIALFFAGPGFQQLISPGIYGALLLFVGIEMGKHGFKTDNMAATLVTGVMAVISVALGFFVGLFISYAGKWYQKRKMEKSS